jgi:hypothetical protein
LAREAHGAVAVHARDDHDQIATRDQRSQLFRSATAHVAVMKLDLAAGDFCELFVVPRLMFLGAADDAYAHGFDPRNRSQLFATLRGWLQSLGQCALRGPRDESRGYWK